MPRMAMACDDGIRQIRRNGTSDRSITTDRRRRAELAVAGCSARTASAIIACSADTIRLITNVETDAADMLRAVAEFGLAGLYHQKTSTAVVKFCASV